MWCFHWAAQALDSASSINLTIACHLWRSSEYCFPLAHCKWQVLMNTEELAKTHNLFCFERLRQLGMVQFCFCKTHFQRMALCLCIVHVWKWQIVRVIFSISDTSVNMTSIPPILWTFLSSISLSSFNLFRQNGGFLFPYVCIFTFFHFNAFYTLLALFRKLGRAIYKQNILCHLKD